MKNINDIIVECPNCGDINTVKEWDNFGHYTQNLYDLIKTKNRSYNNYYCPSCNANVSLYYKEIIENTFKYYCKEFK